MAPLVEEIVILGGSGDGLGAAFLVEEIARLGAGRPRVLGFLNDGPDREIGGYPVLGTLADAPRLAVGTRAGFVAALLKVKQSAARSRLVESLGLPPERFVTLVHPSAAVAASARLGRGCTIFPHVTVMPQATLGDHCSLRAGAVVGHDCALEDFCYVGPNASLAGRARLLRGAHLAPNASVLEGRTVGRHAVVGLGSSVLKDVPDFRVAFGCPAHVVGTTEP